MAKKRQRNKDDSKPQKKKKTEIDIDCSKDDQTTIEVMFARFPNLSECVFGRLDDQLAKSAKPGETLLTVKEFIGLDRS